MASNSEEIKLLGSWTSPFVLRARIALNIKRVEYEYSEENLLSKSELLLKSNPVYKKVPVLIHGDKPICESLIIVQYVDEVWASEPPILPSDPYDRATARFWAAYIDDKLYSRFIAVLVAEGEEAKRSAGEEAKECLILLEEAFVKCSNGGIFFGGDKIGYLDIALGGFLGWMIVVQKMAHVSVIDEAHTPNLFKWARCLSEEDAVKDLLPDTDKLTEFAKLLGAKMRAAGRKMI